MKHKAWIFIGKTIAFAACFCGFSLFFIPLALANIVNIGNVTGLVICTVLGWYVLFADRVHASICRIWSRRAGKILLSALAALVAAVILLACVVSGYMISECRNQPNGTPTVVVLGCKVNGTTPSLMLRERLDAAYDYLSDNPDAVCVLSGGQGSGEDISEAEGMYRYLVAKGVDETRLYREDRSTSTRENLEFSLEIIRENGLNESLAIVTNEFHEYRAACIAAELGLTSTAVPAETEFWLLPTYWVREMYAVLYEWIN
ncbi:MAG: YdcF family protein [Clostridia bacterium]|nr:YdcF family protein [Clostridia bacterium]